MWPSQSTSASLIIPSASSWVRFLFKWKILIEDEEKFDGVGYNNVDGWKSFGVYYKAQMDYCFSGTNNSSLKLRYW